jgi:hypothetical protein
LLLCGCREIPGRRRNSITFLKGYIAVQTSRSSRRLANEQFLEALRHLLKKCGHLTRGIVEASEGLLSTPTYVRVLDRYCVNTNWLDTGRKESYRPNFAVTPKTQEDQYVQQFRGKSYASVEPIDFKSIYVTAAMAGGGNAKGPLEYAAFVGFACRQRLRNLSLSPLLNASHCGNVINFQAKPAVIDAKVIIHGVSNDGIGMQQGNLLRDDADTDRVTPQVSIVIKP